ncbi:hypothetical protein C1H76_1577 [Elsinoe australis]|uniref:Uncharacterized protein n=1 Tax=Elsinoe australis TaxID=40998 RepID=A0A4U7BCU5_9PEZI|nr:hypothetical protein C1H76_1577 [Elsinoe australis]
MSTATTTDKPGDNVTAAATSAASGLDGKAKRPMIQTPVSAAYPSELRTPQSANPVNLKRHDSFRSPVSPPSSYTDFLHKAQSPGGLMSPPNTSGSLSRFPSIDSAHDAASSLGSQDGTSEHQASDNTSIIQNSQHPPITRNPSTDSSASSWTVSSSSTADSTSPVTAGPSRIRPQPPRVTIPNVNNRYPRPNSARTPRGYAIPRSPFSAASVRSPMSARSVQSPYTTSAHPQTPWSASAFSPRVPFSPKNLAPPPSARDKQRGYQVIERHIVTTTRETTTHEKIREVQPLALLEPAPRGKRRKTVSSEEPPQITPTQERHDAAEKRSKSEEMIKDEKLDTDDENKKEE